ncbi:TniQ family protein [Bacillus wiedmannii]|uniref:TniQ family protein n=1 Tax=Bacillus wiedmannii TaxID=1890302 RepID=UPI000CD879DE|nr:TniQ family protein [Bacillus wiedmannii]MBG9831983.1 hypothetical protein [Bacillus wiedmannii]MED3075223.1 TniQ family protein [Bacillus wiedmannii]UOB98025.1 hypothetical protein BTI679_54170 [Bacillus wiedmannii]
MKSSQNNISLLYDLAPKEVYTGNCESLTSYIIRLAKEHNILPGVLVGKILAPRLDSKYILRSSMYGGNRLYDGIKSLNSFNKNALAFTNILSLLVKRTDIKNTTLLGLENFISSRDLMEKNLTWCSVCLEEWGDNESYYPLLWFFKDVKICLKHHCELEKFCFSCKNNMPIMHRKSIVGYCSYCNKWLGERNSKKIKNTKDLLKAQYVYELIANRSGLIEKYSKKSISDVLFQLIHCFADGNLAEFARFVNIPKVTLWDWVYGERLPTFNKILDICLSINSSLIQFLNGDFYLDSKQKLRFEKKEQQILIRRKINREELQRKLEVFLSSNIPLSLAKVSERLGYDRKVLTCNFPEICSLIVNRHKEYCIQQKEERNIELTRSIDTAVNYLHGNEVYPSRRKVEKFLEKPGLLHERKIREEWLKKISE